MLWIWMDLLDSLDCNVGWCRFATQLATNQWPESGGAFQPFRWRWRWMTLGLILDWNWYHDLISLYQSGSILSSLFPRHIHCCSSMSISDLWPKAFLIHAARATSRNLIMILEGATQMCSAASRHVSCTRARAISYAAQQGGVVYCERTKHPLQFWLHLACCHMQVANEAYKGNIGRTNEQCCDQTCSAVKCPEGKKACTLCFTLSGIS